MGLPEVVSRINFLLGACGYQDFTFLQRTAGNWLKSQLVPGGDGLPVSQVAMRRCEGAASWDGLVGDGNVILGMKLDCAIGKLAGLWHVNKYSDMD